MVMRKCVGCGVEEERQRPWKNGAEWRCKVCANAERQRQHKKRVQRAKDEATVERALVRLTREMGGVEFPEAAEIGRRAGAPTREQQEWRSEHLSLMLAVMRPKLGAVLETLLDIATDREHKEVVRAADVILKHGLPGIPKEPVDVEVQGEVVHKVMEWAGWSPPLVIEGEVREVEE